MVISMSRWVSPDERTGYVHIETVSPLVSPAIRHWYSSEGGYSSITRPLTPYGGPDTYSYDRWVPGFSDDQPGFEDRFQVLSGGVVVVDYVQPEGIKEVDVSTKEPIQAPEGPYDTRQVENTVFRLWSHYTWTPFQRKVSFINTEVAGINALFVTLVVPNDRLFENCFSMTDIAQEQLDTMLSDPMALFEGNSGRAFMLGDSVVVPLSDGVRTWTEVYDQASFMTVTHSRGNGDFYGTTKYDELTEIGQDSFSVTSNPSRRDYRVDEFPSTTWRNTARTIMSSQDGGPVMLPRLNFGEGDGRGLNVDGVGGAVYANDNFVDG